MFRYFLFMQKPTQTNGHVVNIENSPGNKQNVVAKQQSSITKQSSPAAVEKTEQQQKTKVRDMKLKMKIPN